MLCFVDKAFPYLYMRPGGMVLQLDWCSIGEPFCHPSETRPLYVLYYALFGFRMGDAPWTCYAKLRRANGVRRTDMEVESKNQRR